MLRFGVSTNAYVRTTLEDAFEAAASLGFHGVEVLADRPHAHPLPLPRERERGLRALARRLGLDVGNVNANTAMGYWEDVLPEPVFEPSLASPVPEHRAWRVAHAKAAIDLARALDAPSVSVTSGRPLVDPPRAMGVLRASLEEVLAHAEMRGVRVGLEYEPGLLVENARELLALLDDVRSPFLGANLDVAHACVNGEDPAALARELGHRLVHVHAADVRGRKHYHLVPGEGDVDWARFLDALEDVGYAGLVTLELYTRADAPDGAAAAGLKHLQGALANRPAHPR